MSQHRFRAMNTDVHVVVVGGGSGSDERGQQELLARAERIVRDREARWSRFLPTSEISQLNAAAGRRVIVSTDTAELVAKAIDAWHLTGGAFDPTVGSSLIAAGYDRTFDEITREQLAGKDAADLSTTTSPGACPMPDALEVELATSAVRVRSGVSLDLGGIAKGETAEVVVAEVLAAGAEGCCVNIGGDLRVAGRAPDERGWTVTLDCPGSPEQRAIALTNGAVCTSTTTRRRWQRATTTEHHLRDPATGAALETGLRSVSVIAARADQAEVVTKLAMCAGVDGVAEALAALDLTGLVVDETGTVIELAGFDAFALRSDAVSASVAPVGR